MAVIFPNLVQRAHEGARLAALHRFGAPSALGSPELDFVATLAARLCGVPYACVTLVDAERAYLVARTGIEAPSLARTQCWCAYAVLDDGITEIPDLTRDERMAGIPPPAGASQLRFYAAAPLLSEDGHAVGTLAVMDERPGALTPEQRATLQGLARQAVVLLAAQADAKALRAARERLEQMATRDDATGLFNSRALLHRLTFEVARARRFRTPLCAVLLELDGLPDGDARDGVLAEVGKLVRENTRMIDIAGRYGATQLCLVLPNTPAAGAQTLAASLREKIAAQPHTVGARRLHVSARHGIGAFDDMDIDDAAALLRAAGAALDAVPTTI